MIQEFMCLLGFGLLGFMVPLYIGTLNPKCARINEWERYISTASFLLISQYFII